MSAHVAILGSGSMATACAIVLAEQAGQRVTIWARDEATASELRRTRTNPNLLPGVMIPSEIAITHDVVEATESADFLLVAIPSQFLRVALSPFQGRLRHDIPVISVVKGIENDTFLRPSEIIQQTIGERSVVALAGPSHAEEISHRMPCSVVAACPDRDLARRVQELMTTDRFRIYTNTDLLGAELAGALKNVISVAAGMSDGLGFGDNAKSALLTRGMVEITRFGVAMGAEPETFSGLAGLGDLITSCTSRHGRNRKVGERLGRGETLSQILSTMNAVAEGVPTTRAVYFMGKTLGLELPIIEQIYRVLFEDVSPADATEVLMRRPTGEE